jgi:hypothetical protein
LNFFHRKAAKVAEKRKGLQKCRNETGKSSGKYRHDHTHSWMIFFATLCDLCGFAVNPVFFDASALRLIRKSAGIPGACTGFESLGSCFSMSFPWRLEDRLKALLRRRQDDAAPFFLNLTRMPGGRARTAGITTEVRTFRDPLRISFLRSRPGSSSCHFDSP